MHRKPIPVTAAAWRFCFHGSETVFSALSAAILRVSKSETDEPVALILKSQPSLLAGLAAPSGIAAPTAPLSCA